jgi:hypothetical protein
MRKYLITFMIMALLISVMPLLLPISTAAQTQYRQRVVRNGRVYYVPVRKPSYYRRHRNRINMAIGTGGGALIGGLIGGRKGMLIGSGVGLGSSALYTYKFNKKKRKYVKVRRY